MKSKIVMLTALAVCGLGTAAAVFAEDAATDAQNKLLAKRAAEADCYRKLAEIVYGLQLSSSTYVRDFVTENDEIRTSGRGAPMPVARITSDFTDCVMFWMSVVWTMFPL